MAVVPSISFERLSCLLFRSTRFSSRSMCANTSFSTAKESVPLGLSDTDRSCASTDALVCRPGPSHRQIRSAWHSSHLPRTAASPSCLSDKHGDLVASEKSDGVKKPRFVTQRGQTRNVIPPRLRNERSMLLAGKMAPRPPLGLGRSSRPIRTALTPQHVPFHCEV
jgi:hypothetical protein